MPRQRVVLILPLDPGPLTVAFAQDLKRLLEEGPARPRPGGLVYSVRIQIGDVDPDEEDDTPVDDPRQLKPIEIMVNIN
jgi:hypothetical protein